MAFPFLARWLPSARSVIAFVLVVAHALASAGLPVPRGSRATAGGRAFPCQTKACGCSTVEDSFGAGCCCSSHAEKVGRVRSCCAKHPEPSQIHSPSGGSCCSSEAQAVDKETQHRPTWRTVLGWDAAKCRGFGTGPSGIISHPTAIPPAEPVTFHVDAPPGARISEVASHCVPHPVRPPVRPPKFS